MTRNPAGRASTRCRQPAGIPAGPVTTGPWDRQRCPNLAATPSPVSSCQEVWRHLTAGWRLAAGNDSRRSATEIPMGPFVRKGDESERKPATERS